MDAKFWHDRWEKDEIGFHRKEANPLLLSYFKELSLKKGSRVFLPLCGKTLDIPWLLSQGYQVAGAELSEKAIEQLFAALEIKPRVEPSGKMKCYSAPDISIFAGDIFDLSAENLGLVQAIYDRAALVALPADTRERYTAHLRTLTARAPQLLITYEYDQSLMDGPPFSVNEAEVRRHYQKDYAVKLMTSLDVPGGLKGQGNAIERVWLLR